MKKLTIIVTTIFILLLISLIVGHEKIINFVVDIKWHNEKHVPILENGQKAIEHDTYFLFDDPGYTKIYITKEWVQKTAAKECNICRKNNLLHKSLKAVKIIKENEVLTKEAPFKNEYGFTIHD